MTQRVTTHQAVNILSTFSVDSQVGHFINEKGRCQRVNGGMNTYILRRTLKSLSPQTPKRATPLTVDSVSFCRMPIGEKVSTPDVDSR